MYDRTYTGADRCGDRQSENRRQNENRSVCGDSGKDVPKAIDDYKKDPKLYEQNMPWYKEQISNCTYRQFTTGFFFGKPDETTQIYDSNTYNKEYTYLGIVGEIKDGLCRIEQRNKFSVGETIEIMKPDGRNIEAEVLRILNEEGKEQESAPHSKQLLYVELSEIPDVYDILRRKEEESK